MSVFIALFEKINFDNTFAKKETLDKSIFYNPVKKVAAFVYPPIEKWYESFKEEHAKDSEKKPSETSEKE